MREITATYRIQFGGQMDFDAASRLAPYLAGLGISHLYASPVFEAVPGSTHGYDVTDYNSLREALGGRAGFERMAEALKAQDIGIVLDIVPNHMAASPHNVWLADVMANGRASQHADVFDIDWEKSADRLVLPVLGAPLTEILGKGEIGIEDDARFGRAIVYYDKRFPLAPDTESADIGAVLARQHYRLHHWRDLSALNYRRFFDITDLIGIRMEDEGVFEKSHRLVRELIDEGLVDALRVDHVDGMRDPKGYLDRLSALFPRAAETPPIFVEKIVEGEERLPADWPVRGETGYAVMPWLDGVFVQREAEAEMTALYEELTGDAQPFAAVVAKAKREIIEGPFAHEFKTLSGQVSAAAGTSVDETREAIEEIAAAFPVYRTYQRPGGGRGEAERLVRFAAGTTAAAKDAVLGVLTDPGHPACLSFQQMTGPVTAKAVEDTSFYRWHRWSVLNEVGGDPAMFGRSAAAFHRRMEERAAAEPLALSATATHDTKRGEDVRARLCAASQRPGDWARFARDWWAATTDARQGVAPVTAYLLFQMAVGFWPMEGEEDEEGLGERLSAYVLKAERERKQDTAWTAQDGAYEARARGLARAAVSGQAGGIAKAAAEAFWPAAADISVARAVLKATIPGVPDIYQGTEATQLSLVDPDNRRAPDWRGLAEPSAGGAAALRKRGALSALCRLRRGQPGLFLRGDYRPEPAEVGILRFTREGEGAVLGVAVRLTPGGALPEMAGEAVIDDEAARVVLADVSA